VIRFAGYIRAEDAHHEIPPTIFGSESRPRLVPYIFTEEEIKRILQTASGLGTLILKDDHPRAVDIGNGEMNRFGDTQAGGLAGRQNGLMLPVTNQPRNWRTSSGLRMTGSVCGFFGAGMNSPKIQFLRREAL
jgi:hypothetical protein